MKLFSTIKRLLGEKPAVALPPPPPEPEEDEIEVPEVTVGALHDSLASTHPPHLLDVREPYEWRQVHMAPTQQVTPQHIPMNEIPGRLAELPADQPIVVICAHGQRSYGVAHYLIENGFDAVSLAGGITEWAAKGGEVVMGG